MVPALSTTTICFTPYFKRRFVTATPAAPTPLITTLMSSFFFPVILRAFIRPARHTIAVPC